MTEPKVSVPPRGGFVTTPGVERMFGLISFVVREVVGPLAGRTLGSPPSPTTLSRWPGLRDDVAGPTFDSLRNASPGRASPSGLMPPARRWSFPSTRNEFPLKVVLTVDPG